MGPDPKTPYQTSMLRILQSAKNDKSGRITQEADGLFKAVVRDGYIDPITVDSHSFKTERGAEIFILKYL